MSVNLFLSFLLEVLKKQSLNNLNFKTCVFAVCLGTAQKFSVSTQNFNSSFENFYISNNFTKNSNILVGYNNQKLLKKQNF
jgi:hypothetical protein